MSYQGRVPAEEGTADNKQPKKICENLKNVLLVLAVLIATVTYQAGLAPPSSIWKENMSLDAKCVQKFLRLGVHSAKECPGYTFYLFMSFNTSGFLSSTILIFVSIQGKHKAAAVVLLTVSLFSMILTYAILLLSMANNVSFLVILVISLALMLILALFLAPLFLRRLLKSPMFGDRTAVDRTGQAGRDGTSVV